TRTPVYVASGGPASAATVSAASFTGFSHPSSSRSAAVFDAPPLTRRIQAPTFIGEVTLNTRSMWWNRSGRPRSETSSSGDTASATAPTYSAVFESFSFPVSLAPSESTEDAPARPPVKKYVGISHVHVGSLTTGRP